jgi:putative transcriptional regulator
MIVDVEILKGQLLIAGPGLFDPNFRRTVILVGEHNEEGALGVILNRRADISVNQVVPALSSAVGSEEPLFFGGPVQPQAAVLLAELEHPERADVLVFGSIGFLTGDVETATARGIRRGRVFAGYAGWGAGQLEAEMEQGSWIVEPARPEDVFTEDPDGLWSAVLRRKGGEYGLISTMPFDPSLN